MYIHASYFLPCRSIHFPILPILSVVRLRKSSVSWPTMSSLFWQSTRTGLMSTWNWSYEMNKLSIILVYKNERRVHKNMKIYLSFSLSIHVSILYRPLLFPRYESMASIYTRLVAGMLWHTRVWMGMSHEEEMGQQRRRSMYKSVIVLGIGWSHV